MLKRRRDDYLFVHAGLGPGVLPPPLQQKRRHIGFVLSLLRYDFAGKSQFVLTPA